MPTYTMLIGVPGSGKSSWLARQPIDWTNTVIASTDNIIQQRAEDQGKTYSEVFQQEIKSATAEMNKTIRDALAAGHNVIHDQTNLTAKTRASKLAQIPMVYAKLAVFFPTPSDEELARRLAGRPGKTIPAKVVLGMKSQLEKPTQAEGFDRVVTVG
jgi:predicted kinase